MRKKGRLSHLALNEKQKAFAEHYAAYLNEKPESKINKTKSAVRK